MSNHVIFNPVRILKDKRVSVTDHRIKLLEYLVGVGRPATKAEIAKAFPHIHRVTLYRLLQHLVRAGVIEMQKNQNSEIYFLKLWNEETNHLHFTCVLCQNLFCLPNIEVNIPAEINGFLIHHINFTASGLCANCAKS
ncbi:MAG: transcriptional repressor [Bacteroidales bacterium]|nr:transcriptional repressor [Bacteroidales bacterium]